MRLIDRGFFNLNIFFYIIVSKLTASLIASFYDTWYLITFGSPLRSVYLVGLFMKKGISWVYLKFAVRTFRYGLWRFVYFFSLTYYFKVYLNSCDYEFLYILGWCTLSSPWSARISYTRFLIISLFYSWIKEIFKISQN